MSPTYDEIKGEGGSQLIIDFLPCWTAKRIKQINVLKSAMMLSISFKRKD